MPAYVNGYDEEIRRFLKSGESVICTHNPLDKVSHKQMQYFYNQYTNKDKKLFLGAQTFFNHFKNVAYTDAEKQKGLFAQSMRWGSCDLDGFACFTTVRSDRFENGKNGIRRWLEDEKPQAIETSHDQADINSFIRLYNAWAKNNGYPSFGYFPDGQMPPYWNFGRALRDLGLEAVGNGFEECRIIDKNDKVLAEVTL